MCFLVVRGEEIKIKFQISKICNCCFVNSRNQYVKIFGFLIVKKKKKDGVIKVEILGNIQMLYK